MTAWPAEAAEIAAVLLAARDAGRTIAEPLSDARDIELGEAYAIQHELTALRLARGERIVGWKLGYTSLAMREQMGIRTPNHGPLTDAMLLVPGAPVPAAALQPRVEPEIGLVLGSPVPSGADVAAVLACCSGAFACLEVVDSVWADYRFTLADNTADGSSAAWVVLGAEVPLDDLAALGVSLLVDGTAVASATGAAASGHPAAGVAWLAGELAGAARGLEAGDLVITGGLTAAHPLRPGSTISAEFGTGAASVSVSVRGTG